MTQKKEQGAAVKSPDAYFGDWFFDIQEYYWDTFGLRRVEVMDEAKNKPLRSRYTDFLTSHGWDKKDASKLATRRFSYTKMAWKKFDFDLAANLEGHCFPLRDQPLKLQVIKHSGEQVIFAVFSQNTNTYIDLITIDTNHFEQYAKSGQPNLSKHYDVNLLPDSDLKYELKRVLK